MYVLVARILRLVVPILIGLTLSAGAASAQSSQAPAPTPPPAKVQQLLDLLDDPDIRTWLQVRSDPASAGTTAAPSTVDTITEWEGFIRSRFASLIAVVPRLGAEFANATTVVQERVNEGRHGAVAFIVVLLIGLGYGAEWLFRRLMARGRLHNAPALRAMSEAGSMLVFTLASAGLFLAFQWPPLLRQIVLTYLLAFIAFRILATVINVLLAAPQAVDATPTARMLPVSNEDAAFWSRRMKLFAGYFLFGWATVNVMPLLEFSIDARRLVAYVLGVGLLVLAIEIVWRRPSARMRGLVRNVLLTAYLVVLWALWVAGLNGFLWVGIYALVLPPLVRGVGHMAEALAGRNQHGTLASALFNVLVVRGARALVMAAAVAWLAYIWRFSPMMSASDLTVERFVEGLLHGAVILLLADLLWQLSKAYIAHTLQVAEMKDDATVDELARRARLRTLLPIFRNTLAVFIAVVAVLTVLSGLGVQIAPLIAGAGIFGVAIGFGSQTLVKDVLSGVFFMLDDAFRVGEYIQSGSYKGTVESFSLRSIRLRHHRGPIFTVPFGDLGAVQNMSRDWVIEKMTINVTYDTDVELARRLVKKIGLQLAEEPEFKAATLEPLKMQGIDSFGDYAMAVGIKMMTKPGEQYTLKRRALMMIKKSFEENGIKIAVPTVQVSGGADGAAAASETIRLRKAAEAASPA